MPSLRPPFANGTVPDVLGTKKSILREDAIVPGSLPYMWVAAGARYAELPDKLRWKFRAVLAANATSTGGEVR